MFERFCLPLLLTTATACLPTQFAEPSVEIEDFDADRGLRALRHERSLDFTWTNPRMHQVVQVTIPRRSREGRPAQPSQCNGVLVASDLVLTATHCLKETAFLNDRCRYTTAPGARRGSVTFDQQLIQDMFGPLDPDDLDAPPEERFDRPSTRIDIAEIAAHVPSTTGLTAELVAGVCTTAAPQRRFDGVLLRLERPVPSRGFARIRTTAPRTGDLLPVIHHISETAPKRFSATRVIDFTIPGMTGVTFGSRLTLLDEFEAPPIQCGSSGAPVFDEEGYVVGLVSGGDLPPGADCTEPGAQPLVFSSMESVLAELNAPVVAAATEVSGFALATFDSAPFTGLTLERSSFGPGAELPRAVVQRTGELDEDQYVVGGYATDGSSRHVLALTAYDSSGGFDEGFGAGGAITHDIPNSGNEEIFDLDVSTFHGLSMVVAAGTMADPDSIMVARFTATGELDSDFGTFAAGVSQIIPSPSSNGSSGAAIGSRRTVQSSSPAASRST